MLDPQPTAPPIPFLYTLHAAFFWVFLATLVVVVVVVVVAVAVVAVVITRARVGRAFTSVVAGRVTLWAGLASLVAGVLAPGLPAGPAA